MEKRLFYADMLAFLADKMGPPQFTPEILRRISESNVRLVGDGGPFPKHTWEGLIAEVRNTAREYEKNKDMYRLVRNRCDLNEIYNNNLIHVIMTVQNPQSIGDTWSRLDELYEAGVRKMQAGYWDDKDAEFAHGFLSPYNVGLKPLGRIYLAQLAKRGFILDLSHLNHKGAMEAGEKYTGPVMISHTGARVVYDHPRNAYDDAIKLVGARDGIVGIYTMTCFLDISDNTLNPWLRHIEHAANLIGFYKICIGSDAPVAGFPDLEAARLDFQKLTAALDTSGKLSKFPPRWPAFIPVLNGMDRFEVMERAISDRFGDDIVKGFMGENVLRFFQSALPKN